MGASCCKWTNKQMKGLYCDECGHRANVFSIEYGCIMELCENCFDWYREGDLE